MCSINNAIALTLVLVLSLTVVSSSPYGNTRIYGGKEAQSHQFPYEIALRTREQDEYGYYNYDSDDDDDNIVCGGAIISEKFVITAAHCLYFKKSEDYLVYVGVSSQSDGRHYKTERFLIHGQYTHKTPYENDVGLIKLKKLIKFSKEITSIELSREFIGGNVAAVVSGLGTTLDSTEYIQYLSMNTLAHEECLEKFLHKFNFTEQTTLCAYSGAEGQGVCEGDSGGPLVYNNTLIGITSWGTKHCASGYPDVFTRVSNYVNWVSRVMSSFA